jgi:hypothetical protein
MITKDINPSFLKALLAEDEVGCVVRSHLYVEAQVDRYLGLVVVESKYLTDLDLSYAKKIDLLCCLGFDAQFRGALKRLGKLRNNFAHDLSSRLTQQSVSDLYNALPDFGRKATHISIGLLYQALGKSGKPPEYKALSEKLKFVLIVLNLERICCAVCDLVQTAKDGNG